MPTLLILGDLHPDAAQRTRLGAMFDRVVIEEQPTTESAARLIRDADFVVTCNVQLTPFMAELARCRLVVLAETGIVHLDAAAAQQRGVRFVNLPNYSTPAVVDYITACLLRSRRPWRDVFSEAWDGGREHKIGTEISTLRVGFVGFGHIGRAAAHVLLAFGSDVKAVTRRPFDHPHVRRVGINDLFATSDAVVICCSLNESSRALITGERLDRLPPGAVLVSIAHQDVLDRDALMTWLKHRRDARAWLDLDRDDLSRAIAAEPNAHISPHLAFFTRQSLSRRVDACIDQLVTSMQTID